MLLMEPFVLIRCCILSVHGYLISRYVHVCCVCVSFCYFIPV